MRQKAQKGLVATLLLFTLSFTQPCYGVVSPSSATILLAATGGIGLAGILVAALFSKDDDNKAADNNNTKWGGEITATGVLLSAPNVPQNLVLKNVSPSETAKIDSVTLGNTIHGVTVGPIGTACQSISPEGTCNVTVTADSADSYGSGLATITYSNGAKTTTANVTVAPTTLQLSDVTEAPGVTERIINQGEDIVLKQTPNPLQFKYTNTGKFNWLPPTTGNKVAWHTMFDDPQGPNPPGSEYYVKLDNNQCGSNSVAPNSFCTFEIYTNGNHIGDWGIIKATGLNIGDDKLNNILAWGGLAITINLNSSDYHLGYRSVELKNTVPTVQQKGRNIKITGIAPSGNLLVGADPTNPVAKYCPPTSSPYYTNDCDDYDTDCTIVDESGPAISLAPGGRCLIWFKAHSKKGKGTSNFDLDLQTVSADDGRINIDLTGKKQDSNDDSWIDLSNDEKNCNFTAYYDKSLYAGGIFNVAGEAQSTSFIARWDGSSWYNLGSGILDSEGGSYVNALTIAKGDLYAGGKFTYAGDQETPNISRWNGLGWSRLGDETSVDIVSALTDMNRKLIVGDTGGSINQWDNGTGNWTHLGDMDNSVYSLLFMDGQLYAGGNFSGVVAKWNSGTSWSSLLPSQQSSEGRVFTLANMGGVLLAGGDFTTGQGPELTFIAKWNGGTNWSTVGDDLDNDVSALTTTYSGAGETLDLYAGGYFTQTSGQTQTILNYVAKLENSLWSGMSPSSPGFNDGTTYSLASMYTNEGSTPLHVYAGGYFSSDYDGNNDLLFIARWDGSSWLPLGAGMDNEVYALTIAPALDITGFGGGSA